MIGKARMTVGVYCVSQGDVGVVPYWSGDEEGDVCEGDVALPRTGTDEPVDMLGYSVVSTFGPGGPGGSCDEEGDIYEGDVALSRTGSNEPVNCVVSTSGPSGRVAPVMKKVTFIASVEVVSGYCVFSLMQK